MKRFAIGLVITTLCFLSSNAYGADAYFIRFFAFGKSNVVFETLWRDDILFFNKNLTPVNVTLVGVSNGSPQASTPPLTIPAGGAVSLRANQAVETAWQPTPGPTFGNSLYVLHLDIPAGVVAESRDEFFAASLVGAPLALPAGRVSMPVFRQLAPANTRQVILGTDLMAWSARINVGIYNGGEQTASAAIELRRVADNSLLDSKTVSVGANTLIQVGAFSVGTTDPPMNYQLYTVVTVSQPSLVYVATLNDALQVPASEEGLFPIVGLAVAINQNF